MRKASPGYGRPGQHPDRDDGLRLRRPACSGDGWSHGWSKTYASETEKSDYILVQPDEPRGVSDVLAREQPLQQDPPALASLRQAYLSPRFSTAP